MLKKIRPSVSLLAAATIAFTAIGNVNVQAKPKNPSPGNNIVLIGDIAVDFGVSNIINGMKYAVSRGADGENLKVVYGSLKGRDQYYYDFGDSFSTAGDGIDKEIGDEIWKSTKVFYDPVTGKADPYNTGTGPIPTSSSTAIKPRSGYEGIITISGDQVTIPANTTPKILKGAIQADDGIFGQTYELFDGDTVVADEVSLATGNTLKVTSEDGTANHTYNLVVQSGGGGGQEDSADLEFKTNLDQGTLSYTAGAADIDPLTVEVQGKDGATTGTISYQWYKQTVGTSPLRATAVPVGEAIEGETSASFTPPVNAVGTTLYYVIATNTEEGKKASSIASKMVTVVVSEGELTDTEFTVSDYVYNDDSKDTKTMGKLTGTAPSGAKITIEANFTELAAVDATDGKWEATFPRQNAGTIIKVTAVADGKTKVETIEVKAADTKDIEAFGKSIDLNKLIEVRDNLQYSADGKDISSGYWMNDKTEDKKEIEAFKTYVNLIEAVLGYRYQISTVDLEYVQNIALSTLETYKDKIHQAGEVSTKATVSISRDGKGTVEVSYKGDSHSVTDGVYKVEADKGTSVTFKATADAGNHFVKWVVDGNDDTTSGTTLTKEVKAAMSVKAVFAKDGEQPVEQFTVTTEATNGKITARKADDNTPITIGADGTFKVNKGTEVVFTATADDDYKFSKWLVNNADAGITNTITRTITADMTVKAEFTYAQIEEGKSRVTTVATNGSIAAEANGTSITIGTDGTFDIDDNTEVTFTATPDSGYKFSKWVVDGTDAGTTTTLTKTITANTTVEAVFVKEGEQPGDTYEVTIKKPENGTVEVSYKDDTHTVTESVYKLKADKDTSVKFTATADEGYKFKNWVVDGVTGETATTLTKTITANTTVEAVFEKDGGSGEGEEMNLTLSPNTYESIKVGEYVYTEVTAAGKNAPDFKIELTVPSNKVTATYANGEIAIGGVSASTDPIVINVKATATGYKDDTGTITVDKVEVPPEDKTETPVITGYELTMLPTPARITGYPDIIAQVTGTAEPGSIITLKDGTGATIATDVVTDDARNWTAILTDRLKGGTEVVAIAKLDGKLESDASTALKIEKVEDTNPISDLIATIDERLKSVGSSEKGDGTDVTPSDTIKEYLPATDYEAITTLKGLLEKLLKDKTTVSVQDITFVETDVTDAWNVTEAKIADIPAIGDTVKLTLSKAGDGNVTISAKDGVIVGDPSTVTNGVYTIKSGATVTINAIPDGTKVTGWVIDGKPEVSEVTTKDIENISKDTEVQVLFVAEDKVNDVKTTIEETNKLIEKKVSANVDLTGETDPAKQEQIIKETVDTKVRAEVGALSLPEGTTIKSIEVIEDTNEDTNARKVVEKTYKARVTLSCGGIEFTVIIEVNVSTEVPDDKFDNLAITDITDAVVGQPSDLVVTGIPTGIKDFNLTTTDADVTIAKSGDKFTLTPSKAMTEKDVTITATATDYQAKDITIKVTATESTTPDTEVALTLEVTNPQNGKVVSVKQDGSDVSSQGSVYTVKSGKAVTFTVEPNEGFEAAWSENVSEVTQGNSNVVTITPTEATTVTLEFKSTTEDKKDFSENMQITNITKTATVGVETTTTISYVPDDAINFKLTSTTPELADVSYDAVDKVVKVTAKKALDTSNTIKVTASADNYNPKKNLEFTMKAVEGETPETKYNLTVTQPTEGGTIVVTNPTNLEVSGGVYKVTNGTEVTFEVKPETGYELDKWKVNNGDATEGVTGNTLKVKVTGTTTVTATMKSTTTPETKYNLTVTQPTEGGTIVVTNPTNLEVSGGVYKVTNGTEVTFEVKPETGYELDKWKVNNGDATEGVTGNTLKVKVTGTTTVTATMKSTTTPETKYNLTVTQPTEGGTIVVTNPTNLEVSGGVYKVTNGTEVTFEVKPETGYELDKWKVNNGDATEGVTGNTLKVKVTGTTTVTATMKSTTTPEESTLQAKIRTANNGYTTTEEFVIFNQAGFSDSSARNATYQIYAKLSDPQGKFNIAENGIATVEFNLGANDGTNTTTGDALSTILGGLSIKSSVNTYEPAKLTFFDVNGNDVTKAVENNVYNIDASNAKLTVSIDTSNLNNERTIEVEFEFDESVLSNTETTEVVEKLRKLVFVVSKSTSEVTGE